MKEQVSNQDRISLRAYLAGQALAGGLEQGVRDEFDREYWYQPSKIARRAIQIADAIIDQLEEGDEQ
jgi:hypothetical protein